MINLDNYTRPALQFSGGKDSLALLYLLRDVLDRITVYWANSGDAFPETLAVIAQVRAWIPHFVEVQTSALDWRQANGNPTDLVPAVCHPLGVAYGLGGAKLSNRFDCCYNNLMLPMHQRMLRDGVDAVIRGTKLCDTGTIPHEGPTGAYDVVLPIKTWSHADVFAYLESVGAPKNALYDGTHGASAPECLTCTAWWDDGKSAYLKAKYPGKHVQYVASLDAIRAALSTHLADLDREIRS